MVFWKHAIPSVAALALVLPGVHRLRVYSLADRLYRPERSEKANGSAPFQSSEGLSLGIELTIRYALDASKLPATARLAHDSRWPSVATACSVAPSSTRSMPLR